MKNTFVGLLASAVILAASGALAQGSTVDGVLQLCQQAGNGQAEENGLEPVKSKTEIPFIEKVFAGEWNGAPVFVALGKRFGNTLCDVQFPDAGVDDYESANADLKKRFGAEGSVYDDPDGNFGYRGEMWADADEIDNGEVENMALNGVPLLTAMVEYADEPFTQTADRTGLIFVISAH